MRTCWDFVPFCNFDRALFSLAWRKGSSRADRRVRQKAGCVACNVTGGHLAPGGISSRTYLQHADSTITILVTPQQQEAIYQEGRIALAI